MYGFLLQQLKKQLMLPTLQKYPHFINVWMNTSWGRGVLMNSTIYGDLPTWSLRVALNDSGIFSDEKNS